MHRFTTEVWDYRSSGIKFVQHEPYEILPGGAFELTCYYQNSDDSTIFGFGTQDKMCMSLLFYYPDIANPVSYCAVKSFYPGCIENYTPYDTGSTFEHAFGTPPDSCKPSSASKAFVSMLFSIGWIVTSLASAFF